MGVDVCDKFAARTPAAPALIDLNPNGEPQPISFLELKQASNKLANALIAKAFRAVTGSASYCRNVPRRQSPISPATKAGLIAVPLFTLFGQEALSYRLAASGARALVTNMENGETRAIRDDLGELACVLTIDGRTSDTEDMYFLSDMASDQFTVDSLADDPALLIFTSGTTGPQRRATCPPYIARPFHRRAIHARILPAAR